MPYKLEKAFFFFAIIFLLMLPEFSFSMNADELVILGKKSYNKNEYSNAIDFFNQAYNLKTDDSNICLHLMKAYYEYFKINLSKKKISLASFNLKKMSALKSISPEADSVLAKAYSLMAHKYYSKNPAYAIGYLEKAISFSANKSLYQKELAEMLVELARADYSRGHWRPAKAYLLKALKFYDNNAGNFSLLGDIAYAQNDLKAAEKYWNKALPLYEKSEYKAIVKKKLIRLSDESLINKHQNTTETTKFLIYYNNDNLRNRKFPLERYLTQAYSNICRDFHYYPKDKVSVVVYKGNDFATAIGTRHKDIGAQYDGKIRIPAINHKWNKNRHVSTERFKELIWHEYTHALVHSIAGNACPRWLNEGLAVYQEKKISKKNDLAKFNKFARDGKLLSLDRLSSWDFNYSDHDMAYLFYNQSYSMVKFLIKRYRMLRVKKLLEDLRDGVSFDEAFEKNFRITLDKFEKRWFSSVQKS